jgi:hypothetical protein
MTNNQQKQSVSIFVLQSNLFLVCFFTDQANQLGWNVVAASGDEDDERNFFWVLSV